MHKGEATLTRETMIEQQAIGETSINSRQEVEEILFSAGQENKFEGKI